MFDACIPLFSYMGTNLGQMPAAAVLRLRLKIPAAIRGTVFTQKMATKHFLELFALK